MIKGNDLNIGRLQKLGWVSAKHIIFLLVWHVAGIGRLPNYFEASFPYS